MKKCWLVFEISEILKKFGISFFLFFYVCVPSDSTLFGENRSNGFCIVIILSLKPGQIGGGVAPKGEELRT